MSYLVTQRPRESGIRLALGAGARDILRLAVGDGGKLIAPGVVIGTGATFVLQRLTSAPLFGLTAANPASGVAGAILAVVALIACYLPAVDPGRS